MVLYKVYFRSQEEREAAIRRIWLMNICRANSIVLSHLNTEMNTKYELCILKRRVMYCTILNTKYLVMCSTTDMHST
ncbi:uncharacterized protein LOC124554038 isoform X3 [Schistocerca americana]|uniref:uncharacterized protein LOC124554038 isoform X3 n=1 Tax=Schistocerca americana TaxID=7009 RepID=UPI001F4FF6B5|nr:uncharacterized protein LOC124554038 isoform X3 [Schistocerca americana]